MTGAQPTAGRTGAAELAELGRAMHQLAARLFPVPRSIAGPGYRRTLDLLEEVAGPMERHRYPTGTRVLDWEVPREWELRRGWIKGPDGETVVSAEESNLHVVSHSSPVHAHLSLDELQPHLTSLPELPDAVPYRTSYYRESWGFCIADRRRRELADGTYEVLIDADLRPGHVELGEIVIHGRSEREVLLTLYSDGRTAQLQAMATLPSHRGRGLARNAMALGVVESWRAGNGLTTLMTVEEVPWVHDLYRQMGYEQVGTWYAFIRVEAA